MTYDPSTLRVEVLTKSGYVEVPNASYRYSFSYDENQSGTLIIGSESASITVTYHGNAPTAAKLNPTDTCRVRYKGETIFAGRVDSTTVDTYPTPKGSVEHAGHDHDTVLTATLLGAYAYLLAYIVSVPADLDKEPAITRISRFCTVTNWDERDN